MAGPSDTLDECPEMAELAAFVEAGKNDDSVLVHVQACDACQDAISALEEEILSLQIPLSEIWFREHVSCPPRDTLKAFELGKLAGDEAQYTRFHLEELGCPHCQARLGEVSLTESPEGVQRARDSRRRTGAATSTLLDELREED